MRWAFVAAVLLAESALGQRYDAAVLGWDADHDAVIAHFDGSFDIRDGKNVTVTFGIAQGVTSFGWFNRDHYLPCLVSQFERDSTTVLIMSFGDRVVIAGNPFVVIYTRVFIANHDSVAHVEDPAPSGGLVTLASAPASVDPGAMATFDYAVAVDRFSGTYAWPADADLLAAGDWDTHYASMAAYWNERLTHIVSIDALPDATLIDAYKAGFITTHIVKDGTALNVGENGYDRVFDHDALGILSTLFKLGDYQDASEFLSALPTQVSSVLGYRDALYKFSWPYALYVQKTGDLGPARDAFDAIKTNTHFIESDRTGPLMTVAPTFDVDTFGNWTVDDWAALFGLTTYRYLAHQLGETDEEDWARTQYASLLQSAEDAFMRGATRDGTNAVPCSVVVPNSQNKCGDPTNANWASMLLFGHWPWDGYVWMADQPAALPDRVDATYDLGLGRLDGVLPADTFGGYPGFSSSYNAGYALSGLRGQKYRSEGIAAYQFLIRDGMSGPYSWWEGEQAPVDGGWLGVHPASGTGSCPHMWGQAFATQALLDSLIVERSDGTLVIGRGVPADWLGQDIAVSHFPVSGSHRVGFTMSGSADAVEVTLSGDALTASAFVDVAAFKNHLCSTSAGTLHLEDGTVELPAGTTHATVMLGDCPAPLPDAGSGGNPKKGTCGCDTSGGLALGLLALARRRRRSHRR